MWSMLSWIGAFVLIRFILTYGKSFYQGFKGFILNRRVDLKKYGAWAVVTGGTDGIGKSYSLELAKRGMNIAIISRNQSKLNLVKSEIENISSVKVKLIQADFAQLDIYDKIKRELEDLDVGVLVNNVGVQYAYPEYFGDLSEKDHQEMLNINLSSLIRMTHLVLPKMTKKRNGCIVSISSGSSWGPLPFMNVYAASKIFLQRFSEALRTEYSKFNVTFQTISPFYISTKINHFSGDLRKVGLFIPDSDTFAESAVNTIGIMDHTTGYLPHSVQYFVMMIAPEWLRTYFGSMLYKRMRYDYLKSQKSK